MQKVEGEIYLGKAADVFYCFPIIVFFLGGGRRNRSGSKKKEEIFWNWHSVGRSWQTARVEYGNFLNVDKTLKWDSGNKSKFRQAEIDELYQYRFSLSWHSESVFLSTLVAFKYTFIELDYHIPLYLLSIFLSLIFPLLFLRIPQRQYTYSNCIKWFAKSS